jgi:hypothetical protein
LGGADAKSARTGAAFREAGNGREQKMRRAEERPRSKKFLTNGGIDMKRFFEALFSAAAIGVILFSAGFGEAAQGYSAADLERMSTFLSNFTELGYMDFDAKEFTDEENPADMLRFGIWHNYVNNFASRIATCEIKDCEWGSLVIDGKYVKETVKKYFDYDMKKLPSLTESDPPYYYDGKLYHFEGADGEAVYFARVKEASENGSGQIIMTGEIYNADDESDILGAFTAEAKPHKYGGKNTWAIISLKTEYGE